MLYFDYTFDLNPDSIIFDDEINIDHLGWKHGDYFRVVNINGKIMLVKANPLEKFIIDGATQNGHS